MLSQRELREMRATVATGLPDLCTIKRTTLSPDGQGGYTEVWAAVYANVPCRLKPLQAGVRAGVTEGGQWHLHSAWALVVAYSQEIRIGERVILGGDTYHVVSVDDDASERVLRQAFLRKVD